MKKNTIIKIGNNKLCLVIDNNIENDRGFIKFFSATNNIIQDDDILIERTGMHGNGLYLPLANNLIKSNEENEFLGIDNEKVKCQEFSSQSWFNDDSENKSAVFFVYYGDNTSKPMYGLTTVDWNENENQQLALIDAITNEVILSVPKHIGQRI